MSAPFDAAKARRHAQRTRDHEAVPDTCCSPADAPTCDVCGQRIRFVRPPLTALRGAWRVGDYWRRPHWRHYPEPPRELCDCGHDPDDHDMRAAPPDCQVAGCPCGEEATE